MSYKSLISVLAYFFVPVLFLLFGCAGERVTENQPNEPVMVDVEENDIFTHIASGMEFPEKVGKFERTSIRHIRNDPENVKVDYELKSLVGKQSLLSVSLYPSPDDNALEYLRKEYGIMKSFLIDIYPKHQNLIEGDIKIGQPMGPQEGLMLGFIDMDTEEFKDDECLHGAFLFAHGKWFIKYRSISRNSGKEKTEKHFNKFMHLLLWPEIE